ncbi:MAG: hypothetical protein KDC34_09790 [Saprospiraceae bacterium]|nr:hypothetical protein [Saprospiraceae bacterium]
MVQKNTLSMLVTEAAKMLVPLEQAVSSPEAFKTFMIQMGWQPDDIPQPVLAISDSVVGLKNALEDAIDGDLDLSQIDNIRAYIVQLIDGINDISNAPDAAIPLKLRADGFKTEFPIQLLQFLLVDYLQNHQKTAGFLLKSLGIVKTTFSDPGGDRMPFMDYQFDLSQIPDLLSNPLTIFENAYGWGTNDFDYESLFMALENFLYSSGVDVRLTSIAPDELIALSEGITLPGAPDIPVMRFIFFQRYRPSGRLAAEIRLVPLPGNGSKKPGMALLPFFNGILDMRLELGQFLAATIKADGKIEGGIGLVFRPGQGIKPIFGFDGVTTTAKGQLDVIFEHTNEEADPVLIIGDADSSRLEYKTIAGKGGIRLGTGDALELFTEIEVQGGKVVIGGGDGDGFIQKILPGDGLSANFDLALGLSNLNGLYFRGSGGLEIKLPAHIDLGFLEVNGLTLGLGISNEGLPLTVGADIKTNLGPLVAIVENMGIKATLSFPSGGGNLGPVDFDLGFKPPNGVGLSLDVGIIKGGGYLFLDPDRGEYAGALEFTFSEIVSLKAIGIITTKMPDGSKGFSLLIIITAEFGTGIQLGFGFTLLGVGGLLGLNRTMLLEPIAEGVRTGAIESIMFPENVIENAPKIISDLKTFFPPEEGTFLIGPMAKLGWGTPTLISVSLGIIIEVPPGNVAILGIIKVALPDEAVPLLILQVNFIGALEVDKQRLWFFASLYESRVLWITIEGEMGLLIDWSDNANFVISVGGFHPQFTPPPLPFPNPKRLAVSMLDTPVARITASGYFAVTSNTVQFGSKTEIYFGFSALNVSGHFGYDVLFQFSPFYFIASASASLSVKIFGAGLFSISISASLEGPTPWKIKGKGKIKLLFFSVSFNINKTWGDSEDTALPPIEVLPLFEAEILDLRNWKAELPASNSLLVSIREIDESEELVLHPVGFLRVSQRKVPLDLTIDKLGNQKPSDVKKLSLGLSAGQLAKKADSEESFAIAQFQEMEDSSKLSRAAYEKQHSGLEISTGGNDLKTGPAVKRNIRYEQIIIDTNYKRFVRRFFRVARSIFTHLLLGNAVARSKVSKQYKTNLQPFSDKIEVNQNTYSVALNTNNQPVDGAAASFTSEALAREYMNARIASDPNLAETLHVIPQHETALAS